jgi:DNA polymerase-1
MDIQTYLLPDIEVTRNSSTEGDVAFPGLINTYEQVPVLLQQLDAADVIAFDTETTGLDFMRDSVHGVSFATDTDREHEWYVCGEALAACMEGVRGMWRNPNKLFVGHNVMFDVHMLYNHLSVPAHYADTQVAQWLVNENEKLGLKHLAEARLGYENLPEFNDLRKENKKSLGKKRLEDVSIFELPLGQLARYGAMDSRLTLELWNKLVYDLYQEEMEKVFWDVEMPFAKVILQMERNGICIDQVAMRALEIEFSAGLSKAQSKWIDMTNGVNYRSSPALGKYLFGTLGLPVQTKTPGGAPQVSEMVLQRLIQKDKTGAVATLLEMKKYEKLLETYLHSYAEKMVDGRIHCNYNQTGTVTGRLSSSNPNLQNVPAHGELGSQLRTLFIAPEGMDYLTCDWSQMELRYMASDSGEIKMIDTFIEGGDLHKKTADDMDVDRGVGKHLNFAWGYGIGPRGLCDLMENSGKPRPREADAKAWLQQFDRTYPTLVAWKRNLIRKARALGYVETMGGRRRRLPDLGSPVSGLRGAAERQCVNARIQGSCGDAAKVVMISLSNYAEWYGAKMVSTVHDEISFEVPKESSAEFAPIVKREMESIQQLHNLKVPIIADPSIGRSWAETK